MTTLDDLHQIQQALASNNGNPIYGASIIWNNGASAVHVQWYKTQRQAYIKAINAAKKMGYTIPKWWQFWRHSDTNVKHWRKK